MTGNGAVTVMRILFLAHLFPLPLDSGGKMKSFYTLKALAERHEVAVLAYVRDVQESLRVEELRRVCGNVEIVQLKRGKMRQLADLGTSAVTGRSFIVSRDFRSEMQRAFEAMVERFRPDVVHIDHLQMAQFVDFNATYKTVLDHHNVESAIIRRMAETSDSAGVRLYARLEWPKLQRYELAVCRKSDLVLTVSDEDRSTLREHDPELANIWSVPIGVDTGFFMPVRRQLGSRNMLSIGTMYWPPNIDSMLYFSHEILPLVQEQVSDCTLVIAGQRPAPSIQALASNPAIKVTGYVDDVRDVARNCGVFIVPLRSGSGVRVKILNAMAMGLPIVSTSIGAEGLEVVSGEHLIIADRPQEFAQAVVKVLSDKDTAASLGENARRLVCERYSWEIVGKQLLSIYDREFAGRIVI